MTISPQEDKPFLENSETLIKCILDISVSHLVALELQDMHIYCKQLLCYSGY